MRLTLLAATALTTTISFLVPGAVLAQSGYDWSGGYAGVTAGVVYSESTVDIEFLLGGTNQVPIYASGGLIGVTAGYNVTMDGVVAGIEADASLANVSGGRSGLSGEFEASLDSLLTLRGRLGFTSGNALFYGTAGIAAGHAEYSTAIGGGDVVSDSGFVTGAVGGVGVEFALTDNMSIKTEGMFYQLSPLSTVGDNGKGGGQYESEYAPGGVTLRTGVNFQF